MIGRSLASDQNLRQPMWRISRLPKQTSACQQLHAADVCEMSMFALGVKSAWSLWVQHFPTPSQVLILASHAARRGRAVTG